MSSSTGVALTDFTNSVIGNSAAGERIRSFGANLRTIGIRSC